MSKRSIEQESLERTLGLPAALAIGVGTMVGAGIFVFPGIAAGEAGPAAMLSFALGGAVAMLVAACAAELATAMPESGGAYYFVSRAFGPFAGMVVGIGQWIGLVFASAFYLVGFGEYVVELLAEFGLAPGDAVVLAAVSAGLILSTVNLFGTRGAGDLQNAVLTLLVLIMTVLLGYGVLDASGVLGSSKWPIPFAPYGWSNVFPAAALIFTSYLGFVQIATVAGEIRNPGKTLPQALMGSVLLVTILYVLTLFVATSTLTSEQLGRFGETAMVEVARTLVGRIGALGLFAAGLLATISSANASILSSSRAVYALSRDSMLPDRLSTVNKRFGTPHLALFAVGVPIIAITLFRRIDVLAEVASLLHLVIYGAICLSIPALRKRRPIWYAPTFRVPGGRVIPIAGACCSLGLAILMEPESQAVFAGIIVLSGIWYIAYARPLDLEQPHPPHIEPTLRQPRILIPVEFPDPDAIPWPLLESFVRLDALVLGLYVTAEQTTPDQARDEFGDEFSHQLEDILADVREHGIEAESELAFAPSFADAVDEYARESEAQAVLLSAPIDRVKRIIVPIYSDRQIDTRLATVVRDVSRSGMTPVTILSLASAADEETSEDLPAAERLERQAAGRLRAGGLHESAIRQHSAETADLSEAITEIAGDEDILVLVEPGDADRTSIFSTLHGDVMESVSCPTLVVLAHREDED